MGYLSKVFNDYYNSSNEKEQIKIKREFRERIWNSLPYTKMDRSFRYKVIEDIIEDKAIIDMNVSVEYGRKIMDVVAQVQDNVKKTVEAMTGLYVESVNIYVQNIYLPKKEESESN